VVRVGIDWVDGAGKTYLADELAELLRASGRSTIRASVDGFHHPRAIRYRRDRGSPEGFFHDSYDYDQLKAALLDPLSPGGTRRYRVAVFVTSRVIPGLAAMALGVARSATEVLVELAVDKRHERTSQPLREDRGAQTRLSQAEAFVGSARLFLFDTISRLWDDVMAGREATMQARAQVRLASWHAVTSATQAVDLIYLTGGATSLYATCPLERAFRDVHAMTQHIAVHPRIRETAGRVLFGLKPEIPLTVQ
jgi:alkylation response protein AidB-like acyl-CoA dehydrogenase